MIVEVIIRDGKDYVKLTKDGDRRSIELSENILHVNVHTMDYAAELLKGAYPDDTETLMEESNDRGQ